MPKKFQEITPHDISALVQALRRNVHTVVWHCDATRLDRDVTPQEIDQWHKNRKFAEIGYNLFISKDAKLYMCRDWDKIPAHVAGFNTGTLGFCYSGGLDKNGKPADTRTPEQTALMLAVSEVTKGLFEVLKGKSVNFKGHRDFSPDKNGNGIIEPWEFLKACPCFDVKTEIQDRL